MLDCFTFETAHHFGDVLPSMFRLRQRVFNEQQSYGMPCWRGMEFDQYDTPAAHYAVWRDDRGTVRGVIRVSPTTLNYMLEDIWPDWVTAMPLPKSPSVWEATRCGVDPDLPRDDRRRILAELVLGYQELGLMLGLDSFLGVSYPRLWQSCFENLGWKLEVIGPTRQIEGKDVVPARMPVSPAILAAIRKNTGVWRPVLRTADDLINQRVAAE